MAHHFGRLPSEILEVDESGAAFDFDLACSHRLTSFENERDAKRMEIYFKTLGVMFTGKAPADNGSESGEPEEW